MMEKISYKQVLDSRGDLVGLEIWQGARYITISLGYADPSYYSGYKWTEIKKTIDRLQKKASDDVQAVADEGWLKTLTKDELKRLAETRNKNK